MRILQICNKVPFPPKDGGCIAMNNLTEGLLKEGHDIKVLAINTPKNQVDIPALPADYRSKTNIEAVFIDTSVKAFPAFLNLFSSQSYNINRFYSEEFENKIISELNNFQYDIIQLESIYVSMYVPAIRKHSKAKIVLRSHNIEHQIWERNAAASTNFLKSSYFSFLAKRLKRYELSSLALFDAIAPISKGDAEWFSSNGYLKPLIVVPFGIKTDNLEKYKKTIPEARSVFHIGAMDWQPNVEGLNWFLREVWDKVLIKFPDVKLYLAGRATSDALKNTGKKNVVVLGEVENAYEFISSKGLMIIPLLSGGGMRVKLIEGMALGKIVASTSIGAEGVDCEHNKNILIADDANAFVNVISRYLEGPHLLQPIADNAVELVEKNYNNAVISKKLSDFYKELIK